MVLTDPVRVRCSSALSHALSRCVTSAISIIDGVRAHKVWVNPTKFGRVWDNPLFLTLYVGGMMARNHLLAFVDRAVEQTADDWDALEFPAEDCEAVSA